MSNNGWISIYRDLQEHWLWKEKREFSKLEAWIDILLTVNHTEQKVMVKNTLYIVNRGESIKCLDTWGKRWNWNKSKVRRFLIMLQNDSMIVVKNETKTTRLTVCNYDSYQSTGNASETQTKRKRNASETQVKTNNNDNNINNENNDNNIINNNVFKNNCLKDNQWIEITAMQNKVSTDVVNLYLSHFNDHLITMEEQKRTIKDYKQHFVHWLNKQDLSQHRKKVIGRTNQI